MGYGASPQDARTIPASTFEFATLSQRLRDGCEEEGTLSRDVAVTFITADGVSTHSRYCRPDAVGGLFDLALGTADLEGSRLEELSEAQPPLPRP